jgi:hypothetical protein
VKLKRVCRWDSAARLYRVGRLTYDRGDVGDGEGYSVKVSLGLTPKFLRYRRELFGWILTVCGVRLHYRRSYGGRFAD